jgi:hypothetical protein
MHLLLLHAHGRRIKMNTKTLSSNVFPAVHFEVENMSFLSAGLKFHDITVSMSNSAGPKISFAPSPTARCEIIAPVIIKKNPA